MNLRFTLFASALLLLSACSKFENGPNVSFRTPEERIMGEWLSTSNVTGEWEMETQELRLEFLEEQIIITEVNLDGDGYSDDNYYWRISGDNLEILREYGTNEVAAVLDIVWLSNKRMTLLFTGEVYAPAEIEIEFEKQ